MKIKKKKKAIFNILNFNGSYMGSVKVTNNLLQKRKWIIKYWIWKPGYLMLLVSFSVVVWFYRYHYCFLGWLFVCVTRTWHMHSLSHSVFCAVTAEAKYILYTQIPHMQIYYISYAKLAYVRNLRNYARSSYAKLSICHSLWFDYRIPLCICVS